MTALDIRVGDVVEARHQSWPEGSVIRGAAYEGGDHLRVCGFMTDIISAGGSSWSCTVISRAPRPLYVNHPRTEPAPGDVVRDADSDRPKVWMRASDFHSDGIWLDDIRVMDRDKLPARLRLLVDGTTGQVVPA